MAYQQFTVHEIQTICNTQIKTWKGYYGMEIHPTNF